jgi:hypothetical protein
MAVFADHTSIVAVVVAGDVMEFQTTLIILAAVHAPWIKRPEAFLGFAEALLTGDLAFFVGHGRHS